jgi:hypothetical protein
MKMFVSTLIDHLRKCPPNSVVYLYQTKASNSPRYQGPAPNGLALTVERVYLSAEDEDDGTISIDLVPDDPRGPR